MKRLDSLEALQAFQHQCQGKTVALVPTMGALHEGHGALIRYATTLADVVVVSIYVNPLQFGPTEDFAQYPRTLEADWAACQTYGAHAVFLPTDAMMYPHGREHQTVVVPPASLTAIACGASRSGHFEGVCTVVLKLFNLLQPHVAIFGEKDAQQLVVLRRMVHDFNCPIELVGHPIVRVSQGPLQGVALSSRNQYLTHPEDQRAAQLLNAWLTAIQKGFSQASSSITASSVFNNAREAVFAEVPESVANRFTLDYLMAVDRQSWEPVERLKEGDCVLMAAYIGQGQPRVRLIDNQVLSR